MTHRGPWSVKGIDSRAREIAREAAREEGMTLGAYLNRLILEEDMPEEAAPPLSDAYSPHRGQNARIAAETQAAPTEPSATALDRLTRRVEAAEARSTLAITGIDQSVVGLLSRLENAEHNQQAMGGHFESLMDDIQKTYDALSIKVKRIEADDSSASNLRALKALEDALGKLASHVYEENELVAEEANAVKARLESGLGELAGRMDGIDSQIKSKLDTATSNFLRTIEQAELRTEGTSRHLAERFKTVELDVAEKLSHIASIGSTMDNVHKAVTGSLTDMNDKLGHMQERLSRAETLTDKAMHGLESRFEALDSRLANIQAYANEDVDQAMRRQFEERFETLSEDLRQLVAATRAELAEEIEAAAGSVDAEVLNRLNTAITSINDRLDSSEDMHAQTIEMVGDTVTRITDSVDQRLTANQEQQSRAIEQIGVQVSRISSGLDERLEKIEAFSGKAENDALREEMIRFTNTLDERLDYLEDREDETVERVSTEIERLADRFDQRVKDSENRSADAIAQVGQQVSSVASRIEQRQAEALKAFAAKLDGTQKRQDARLTSALSNVSDRLERMQEQSLTSMSPVQKAISALAQRLEAIEDFSSPPYADRGDAPAIPKMVSPSRIDTSLTPHPGDVQDSVEHEAENDSSGMDMLSSFLNPIFTAESDILPKEDIAIESFNDIETESDEFEPGYKSWADDANALLDDTLGTDHLQKHDPYAQSFSDLPPPVMDSLTEDLIWSDGREEARDNDIFENDFPAPEFVQTNDALSAFEAAAAYVPEEKINPYKDDYIQEARRAAREAAMAAPKASVKPERKKVVNKTSEGINPKRAGLAALAAVAVAGTAGVLYVRGQNVTPSVSFDESANTLSAAASAPVENPLPAAVAELTEDTSAVAGEGEALGLSEDQDLFETTDQIEPTGETATQEPNLIPDPVIDIASPAPQPERAVFSAPPIPSRLTLGKAAQDGHPIAQFEAGMADLRAGNFESGANWLKKSADQGFASAQHELAILHESGTGTTRDFAQARHWHGVAARSGHVEAMFDFATYNASGEGGDVNAQVAAEWFRKAAEFGHADSQYNIAQIYATGSGISPSQTDALFWYELAARNNDLDARAAADALLADGNVSQEAAAQVRQRVDNWRPTARNAVANGQVGPQAWNNNAIEQTLGTQRILAALGYTVGTPDGIMGEQTRTAIRAFEKSVGLPVTGDINDRLVDALNAAADAERRRS